jgi:hypothetical protein
MTYWQELRLQVLERDNYTCQICFKQLDKLDVHHIIPRHKNGLDSINNLISVCKSCHWIIELKRKIIPRIYNKFQIKCKVTFLTKISKMGRNKMVIIPKSYWDKIKDLEKDLQVKITIEDIGEE